MAEPTKNTFDFGTGSIDKDQWLRDIDAELDEFISRYAGAVNKHRAALIRQAFSDLRGRIANGDMLNRTADGNYQFGSALNREDKHMQEAYQRALGFMGQLARRQLTPPTPAAEPEKKKIGSLEERYIRSLNPSGKLNTKAYWDNQTDDLRRESLTSFLNKELQEAGNYNDFEGFGTSDEYKKRLNTVLGLLNSKTANDYSLQQLGFTQNWLTKPKDEEETEEAPKTRLEEAQEKYQAAMADLQAAQIEQLLAALEAPEASYSSLLQFNPEKYWTYDSFIMDRDKRIEALKYVDKNGNEFLKAKSILGVTPTGNGHFTKRITTRNTAWNGLAANEAILYALRQYAQEVSSRLNNYFRNLGVNYQSIINNDKENLKTNLALLFVQNPDNKYVMEDVINNLFVKLQDGKYGLKGSTLSYDPSAHTLYNGSNIDAYQEGGVIKGLNGLIVDPSYYRKPKNNTKKTEETSPDESKQQFSTAENARIAATIADIASMGAAFVPGYGTAASAVLGLGSTATNFGADLADGQGLWGATKNAGFGLAADVMGLIPGLGGVGKGAKIARNLMWAVPKMMQWINTYQGLQNAREIKNSIMKLTSPSSMTVQDWQNVSQALQIMTGHGRSVATKVKKAAMSKTTNTTTDPEYYVFTNKGKQKVSDETFKKLREAKGTKARQALTLDLMGEGVTLQQTRFAPWNTSTRFGAFKEVPGQTRMEVQNKHKGWYSDENLVERAANLNPSVDIRNILYRANPYKVYYQGRVPRSGPLPLYLERPVLVLPDGFGVTKEGMKTAGFKMEKSKRKPLTEEQKLKRKESAAKRKQEKITELKKREETAAKLLTLRQLLQNMSSKEAMLTDIPSTDANHNVIVTEARKKVLEALRLNSRWALEEVPDNFSPQVQSFYDKYHSFPVRHKFGGILKALRNGGIIKALSGLQFPDYNPNGNFNSEYYLNWVNLNWGNPENLQSVLKGYKEGKADFRSKNGLPVKGGDQLRYENANGDQDFMSAYQEQLNYYNKNEGASIFGDVRAYYNALKTKNPNLTIADFITLYNSNVDKLRELAPKKLTGVANEDKTWGDYNTLFNEMYGSYSPFSEGLKDTLGESTWRRIPNTFNGINDRENLRHGLLIDSDPKSKVIIDNTGHLVQPDLDEPNNNEVKEEDPQKDGKGKSGDKATDKETSRETEFETKFKNPWDPTLGIIGLKTLQGILGNKDIYGNLIKEMPLAPLRDPIDRKLAIVGWQERILHGQNQLADLRRVQQILRGSDQQTNFATALETERVGRDIMDKAFMEDSGRQFETAGKSWNLDNEDYLYNIKARDDNEKSIKDRARAIAQIRAAWRSGDQNIKMGAIADTGNWLMKKFQREQDMVDKARAIALGTPEEWAQSQFTQRLGNLANKKASDMTEAEKEKVKEIKAQVLKEMRSKFAGKYYDTFHNPWFGGGSSEVLLSKDGGSLEREKLRLRGKDNDRFASMIKDLRKTHRRRR